MRRLKQSAPPIHSARIVSTPLRGVYCTSTRSGRHFGRHWHDVYGFGTLEKGAQSWWSGRGQVSAYADSVICTNPGEVHDGRPLGVSTRQWRIISVEVGAMADLVGLASDRHEIVWPVIDDNQLATVLQRLFLIIEHLSVPGVDAAANLACEEALTNACTLLMSRHTTCRLERRIPSTDVSRVRDRLADNVANAPTLAELAALTGLSRYQLLRRFEKTFGLPPHAWLVHHRVQRARSLICAGYALADAAASVGFSDQSHMTRAFVRQYGYTPGAWRRVVAAATKTTTEGP